jgi:acyl-ACP thioesterase
MKNKLGTYKFHIDPYLTDFRGKATLPLIGSFLLQVATKHAEERGFGYQYMTAQNRAWVLSRLVIEMHEYPDNEQDMCINTWVAGVNKLFTERHFSFQNGEGKTIGYAKTVWAGIDIATRRPANVLELFGLGDFVIDVECPVAGFRKIVPLKDEAAKGKFTIRYSDVDINKHLNSIKYIEHFVDMFDIEQFRTKEIRRFEIHFAAEALYGQRVLLFQKQEADNVFVLEMKSDEGLVSAARVEWG